MYKVLGTLFIILFSFNATAADPVLVNRELETIIKFDVTQLNETTLRYDETLKEWVVDLAGIIKSFGYFAKYIQKNPEKIVLTVSEKPDWNAIDLELNVVKFEDTKVEVTDFQKQGRAVLTDGSTTAFRTSLVLPTRSVEKAVQDVMLRIGFPSGFEKHPPRLDLKWSVKEKKWSIHSGVLAPLPLDEFLEKRVLVLKKFAVVEKDLSVVDKKAEVKYQRYIEKDFSEKVTERDLPYFQFQVDVKKLDCKVGKPLNDELFVGVYSEASGNLNLVSLRESEAGDKLVPVLDPLRQTCKASTDATRVEIRDGGGFKYYYSDYVKDEAKLIRSGNQAVGRNYVSAGWNTIEKTWKVTVN